MASATASLWVATERSFHLAIDLHRRDHSHQPARFALHMDSHRGWAVVSGARVRDFLAISPRAKVLRVPLFVHEERGAQRSVVQCIGSSPPRDT